METTQTFQERSKEMDYERGILSAVLYFSTTCSDSIKLPTIDELVRGEIVDAIAEYTTGHKQHHKLWRGEDLEHRMWLRGEEQTAPVKRKLPDKLENAFAKLLESTYERDEMGDGGWHSWFKMYFKSPVFGICGTPFISTYSLSMELVRKVQKEILPNLPKEEVAALEELGRIMRKYVDMDLKHIAKSYCW
ncbi:MAG: hypothetical protein HYT16_00345 [DPANN group archaeon]|nr:hypothetical protein [DPANN group archaeon]